MKNIAIIGSGSWGTALGQHLAEQGHKVLMWSFTEAERDLINNERKCKYIPDIVINENITSSNNIEEVVKNSDIIFHVSPSKYTREIFKNYKEFVGDKPVIICSKGIEDGTLYTLDKVLKDELPSVRVAALSGPSYATEVVKHIPTAIILASEDKEILEVVPKLISCDYIRIYKSTDVVGVELGGALKNIIALCSGALAEYNFGTNAEAALITRGLAEISRLGKMMGAHKSTFYGLSGLGDLILTCSSDESRNRRAGRLFGKGLSVEEVKNEIGMTIESIENISVAKKLSEKYEVEMPIVDAVYNVLYKKLSIEEATKLLMTRDLKFENE